MKSIEKIETALALEMLAYHDKNYLANDLLHNEERSEEMQRLLSEALAELKKAPAKERELSVSIAWDGKCCGCKNDTFATTITPLNDISKEICISARCLACGRVMAIKYGYPDLCATYNTIP